MILFIVFILLWNELRSIMNLWNFFDCIIFVLIAKYIKVKELALIEYYKTISKKVSSHLYIYNLSLTWFSTSRIPSVHVHIKNIGIKIERASIMSCNIPKIQYTIVYKSGFPFIIGA